MGAAINGAMEILEKTSRTFFIPINRLPTGLLEAVASGYLCLRAIDEIEDHPFLDPHRKAQLLRSINITLQASIDGPPIGPNRLDFFTQGDQLPEVSVRLEDWIRLAPKSIAPRIWDATATMAERMAYWAENNWQVHTETDLDRYTFGVAGAVGLMLSDLWAWFDGTKTDRVNSIGFGRGLQAVNILRNHADDLARGVDFFPDGWKDAQMQIYCRRHLSYADAYIHDLPQGPVVNFCKIPLALAYATIDALAEGKDKLSRDDVIHLVSEVTV